MRANLNTSAIDVHTHLFDVAFGSVIENPGRRSGILPDMFDLFEFSRYKYLVGKDSAFIGFIENSIKKALYRKMESSSVEALKCSMSRSGARISIVHPVFPHVSTKSVFDACDFKTTFPFSSPPPDGPGSLETAEREIDSGCLGVKIHPLIQEKELGDKGYMDLFKLCAFKKVPMLTHFGGTGRMFGIGAKTGHMDPGGIGKIAKIDKEAVLIAGHCGLWQNGEVLAEIKDLENVYTDTSFQEPSVIEKIVRTIGSERVLLGSDFPIGDQRICVENVLRCRISDEDKENILNKNALRLFKFHEKRMKFNKYIKNRE